MQPTAGCLDSSAPLLSRTTRCLLPDAIAFGRAQESCWDCSYCHKATFCKLSATLCPVVCKPQRPLRCSVRPVSGAPVLAALLNWPCYQAVCITAPSTSLCPLYRQVPQSAGLAADTKRKALLNRLRYRSQQRGFLEMDLLVGLWAERHLASMSDAMLAAYEEVLSVENPDLYKWLTGRELAPSELQSNIAFKVGTRYLLQAGMSQ